MKKILSIVSAAVLSVVLFVSLLISVSAESSDFILDGTTLFYHKFVSSSTAGSSISHYVYGSSTVSDSSFSVGQYNIADSFISSYSPSYFFCAVSKDSLFTEPIFSFHSGEEVTLRLTFGQRYYDPLISSQWYYIFSRNYFYDSTRSSSDLITSVSLGTSSGSNPTLLSCDSISYYISGVNVYCDCSFSFTASSDLDIYSIFYRTSLESLNNYLNFPDCTLFFDLSFQPSIQDSIGDAASDIQDSIDDMSSALSSAIVGSSEDIIDALSSSTSSVNSTINTTGAYLLMQLNSQTNQIVGSVTGSADDIIDAIEASSDDIYYALVALEDSQADTYDLLVDFVSWIQTSSSLPIVPVDFDSYSDIQSYYDTLIQSYLDQYNSYTSSGNSNYSPTNLLNQFYYIFIVIGHEVSDLLSHVPYLSSILYYSGLLGMTSFFLGVAGGVVGAVTRSSSRSNVPKVHYHYHYSGKSKDNDSNSK